ncbi:MAG: pyruvate kinase [Rhodobacteraceae bacterium]|nr:pyruvate kinase [Paracoccaceae bacterium]
MTLPGKAEMPERPERLLEELLALRDEITGTADTLIARFEAVGARITPEVVNLAHYLVIRHHDLRPLQRALMWRGLSSMGRLESRVLPTLDAIAASLAALCGRVSPHPAPTEAAFFTGEARLEAATDALFGAPPLRRRCRVMVTLPSEAAGDAAFVLGLARAGMDVARINCAHDDAAAWRAMTAHVRAAADAEGREIRILMDVAGPKIRTEAVQGPKDRMKILAGETLRLVAAGRPRVSEEVPFSASVSLPEMVTRLAPGDRLRYDDGKLEGVVESLGDGEAVIRVRHTKTGGTKLKPEKGINLPDTALGLSPLTAKDEGDLATVVECADMIGYSFVSRAEDIDLLEEVLARFGAAGSPLGLVAKIERPEAVKNLPDLIARVAGRRPFGVMIARGDLAAELGFTRVAEMQEEILWLCEAASVPAVWATQVLEELVKTGLPSRGEMTDAAMAARAECVMLNKGPAVAEAITLLDELLGRMDAHLFKKTPRLRALKSW